MSPKQLAAAIQLCRCVRYQFILFWSEKL